MRCTGRADTTLGRDVAIKVLKKELARDRERLERFEREAKLLAQLSHTNIATIHGLEEANGQKFLVMELVEGETLAERIARGRLPSTTLLHCSSRSLKDSRPHTRRESSTGT